METARMDRSGNDERTFYRSLDRNLTQLDFSVRVLAAYQLSPDLNLNNPLSRAEINKVESDAKAVCEARPKVSELGDTAILEQLNKVCAAFRFGEEHANSTGGFAAVIAAKIVAEKELLQQLRNDVALKAMSNTATEECSLENAVDIQTAYFLANFDAARAGQTPQALEAMHQELLSLHARVPQACTNEMIESASDASLFQYCSPANSTAWATAMQSVWQAVANYVATGNREAFNSAVRTIMDQCLRSVPRQCWFVRPPQGWFVPPPQPATPPLQQFNPQIQQLINNVNNIARQGHETTLLRIGNIVRR